MVPFNSELQSFGFRVFLHLNIKSFWLPPKMERIGKSCFLESKNLAIFEIGDDTNMEYVDLSWFIYTQNMILMICIRLKMYQSQKFAHHEYMLGFVFII